MGGLSIQPLASHWPSPPGKEESSPVGSAVVTGVRAPPAGLPTLLTELSGD